MYLCCFESAQFKIIFLSDQTEPKSMSLGTDRRKESKAIMVESGEWRRKKVEEALKLIALSPQWWSKTSTSKAKNSTVSSPADCVHARTRTHKYPSGDSHQSYYHPFWPFHLCYALSLSQSTIHIYNLPVQHKPFTFTPLPSHYIHKHWRIQTDKQSLLFFLFIPISTHIQ